MTSLERNPNEELAANNVMCLDSMHAPSRPRDFTGMQCQRAMHSSEGEWTEAPGWLSMNKALDPYSAVRGV